MRVYAHQGHRIDDTRRRRPWHFAEGAVTEVPDDIGRLVCEAYPERVCDVSGEENPAAHVCSKTPGYEITAMVEPPQDVMARPRGRPRKVAI